MAGRGFGKTRSGAEWVRERVEAGARRLYLVGSTAADVRDVMVTGESGILAVSPPWNRPEYRKSDAQLVWPNGAVALLRSAEKPDRLRGPAADTAWCDELAAWKYPQTWDQVQFGLRSKESGLIPRACVTTTPRPIDVIRSLVKDSLHPDPERRTVVVTRGSTYENAGNLAPTYMQKLTRRYEGTRLGRQELLAEILDDAPGALWRRSRIDDLRVAERPEGVTGGDLLGDLAFAPEMRRVVVAVDPAVTAHRPEAGAKREGRDPLADDHRRRSNETGILVGGVGEDGHGYLLEDASGIYTPAEWASIVVRLFDKWGADRVTCEVNQGGDLVASNLRTVRRSLPVKQVRATRGKFTRAEPVASLVEQGRIHHVGSFGPLEDQLCSWEPDSGAPSPDRLDAYVWLFTDLMLVGNPNRGPVKSRGEGTRTYQSPMDF